MLTSTRKDKTIQSTLHHTFKTHSEVLPQPRTLEESLADTPGQARNGAIPNAGVQDVRGEPGLGRRHRGTESDPASGVTRIAAKAALQRFLFGRTGGFRRPSHFSFNNKGRAFLPAVNDGVSGAMSG